MINDFWRTESPQKLGTPQKLTKQRTCTNVFAWSTRALAESGTWIPGTCMGTCMGTCLGTCLGTCMRTGSSYHVRGDPLADCNCSVATDRRRAACNMLALRISESLDDRGKSRAQAGKPPRAHSYKAKSAHAQ